jgi:hypothetical protein
VPIGSRVLVPRDVARQLGFISDDAVRVHADFNGLFGDLLCLSHGGTAT